MHRGKVDVKRIARPTRCQSVFLENCRGNLFSSARSAPSADKRFSRLKRGNSPGGRSVWAIRFAECKFAYLLMVGKIAAAEIILLYRAALLNLSSGTKGIFIYLFIIIITFSFFFFNNNAFTIIERRTEVNWIAIIGIKYNRESRKISLDAVFICGTMRRIILRGGI